MVTVADCAAAFERLLDVRYEFHLGHKNKLHRLSLSFTRSEFFHLAGLHKLAAETAQLRRLKREIIFQRILDKPVEMETLLSKNLRYGELQDRLLPLMKLEEILDSEHLIFRYSSSRIPYSKIRADYIINGKLDDTEAFVFLVTNLENCSCCSIFCKNEVDYTKQQLKFSILLKRKIRQSDGKVLYEYIRTGYQV